MLAVGVEIELGGGDVRKRIVTTSESEKSLRVLKP